MPPSFDLELSACDRSTTAHHDKIRLPLKAYQVAEVQKALAMECGPVLVDGHQVRTNIGIFGDPAHTGKTLTALALIGSVVAHQPTLLPIPHQRVFTGGREGGATLHVLRLLPPSPVPAMIQTTLIVVPRGPIFTQWAKTIKENTTLNACILQGVACVERLTGSLAAFDCVLIHSGILKHLCNQASHSSLLGFDRIIVDEAHIELGAVPALKYRFLWLMSSSYGQLIGRAFPSPTCLGHGLEHILCDRGGGLNLVNLIVVRSSAAFIAAHSVPPPPIVEHTYVCRPAGAVHQALQMLLQAGDVVGAVKALGGSCMPEALISMNRVMAERLGQECGICMEAIRSAGAVPVMLECYHVFCGRCVMPWIGRTLAYKEGSRSSFSSCPTCRHLVNNSLNLAIAGPTGPSGSLDPVAMPLLALTAEETLVKLIKDKPQGKWVVYVRTTASSGQLKAALLGAGILYAELGGSGRQMNEALHNFKGRVLQVLLMALTRPITGIRIECATDAVLFNVACAPESAQPFAGLKPRNGNPLVVHHLIEEA